MSKTPATSSTPSNSAANASTATNKQGNAASSGKQQGSNKAGGAAAPNGSSSTSAAHPTSNLSSNASNTGVPGGAGAVGATTSNWAKIAAGGASRAAAANNSNNNNNTNSAVASPAQTPGATTPVVGGNASVTSSAQGSRASSSSRQLPNAQQQQQQQQPGQQARKPSAAVSAEPFSTAAGGRPVPIKPAGAAGVAFGNVNTAGTTLSSSPAQRPPMAAVEPRQPQFGSIPSTATGSKANSTTGSATGTTTPASSAPNAAASDTGSKPAGTLPKIDALDFNSFFQGGGGEASPENSPAPKKDAAAPSQTASNLQPSGSNNSNAQQQSSGPSSRRASTYENNHQAMSPRMMAAGLPQSGTPGGGVPAHLARSFSPANMNNKGMPGQGGQQYYQGAMGSPSFAPGQMPMSYNGPQTGAGSRQQTTPYMQSRGVPIPGQHIHHQHNRSLGPSSPRVSHASTPGAPTAQPFYPGQNYGGPQWQQQQPMPGYPSYNYAQQGYYPQQNYYAQGQQPGRPSMQTQHSSQQSISASPAPAMRPGLSQSGSSTWTPASSTNNADSSTPSGYNSGMTSPAPSSAAGPAGLSFRPPPHMPGTPSHGQSPSISQTLHPSTPAFTPQHAHNYSASSLVSPTGNMSLSASASSFRPIGVSLAKAPSKALVIKKPPPKEEKDKADKEKADKEKAEKEKAESDKKEAEKINATVTADQKSQEAKDIKAASDKAASDNAAADKAAADKAAAAKAAEDKAAADKAAEAKRVTDEKAAADKAQQAKQDQENREKADLDEKNRKQEAEATQLREQQAAEAKATKETEEAEKKQQAEDESARRQADVEKAQLTEEQAASATAEVKETKETEVKKPAAESTDAAANQPKRPEPLDLSKVAGVSEEVITAPGSALSHARIIEDLSAVSYPESVKSPDAGLNLSAKPGKFRYDRDFLLQFMEVCKEKPEQLPSLEAIGMTDEGPPSAGVGMPRSVSHGGKMRAGPGSVPSTPMTGRGMPPNINRTVSSGFAGGMGNFAAPNPAALSSAERFAASNSSGGPVSGRPMARTPSTAGGGIPMGGASGRGGDRRSGRGTRRGPPGPPPLPDNVAPLETNENRWTPSVQASRSSKDQPDDSPELVERKVKALLNKLTIENFDSISKQILDWANKSATESDGRILKQVIALIFEKATDEATWSAVYAKLCLYLNNFVSAEVADQSIQEQNGTATAGGRLFRRYLLTRCQADYERGWAQKESATAAAKGKAADDKAKKDAIEKEAEAAGVDKEQAVKGVDFSEEYYLAEKAKRRGLGLVRFIGELYKLSMLKERIMHECIKKLLANLESPEEEDIESLCRLLTTVGGQLDGTSQDSKSYMDIYFMRLQAIVDKKVVSSRLQFMILDMMDARKHGWKVKLAAQGPKSIAEVHQDAMRQREEETRRASQGKGLPSRIPMDRGGSRRGQGREAGPDGWQSAPAPRPQKAGDLASLGKIRSSSGSPALGMLGPRASKQQGGAPAKEESSEPKNPFALLAGDGSADPDAMSPPAETSTRRPLQLQPRTKTAESDKPAEEEADAKEDEEEEDAADDDGEMSEATRRSIQNSVAEYLSVRMVDEGKQTFIELAPKHRGALAKLFIDKAVNGKADVATAVTKLFKAIGEDDIIPTDVLRDAFQPFVVDLEDTVTDAPKAFFNVANLLKAAQVSKEDVEYLQGQMVSNEDDLEAIQKRLMEEYEKASP